MNIILKLSVRKICLLVIKTVLSCQLCWTAYAGSSDPNRPNLVIVYADDLGFGDVQCYGDLFGTSSTIPTPNMDKLAGQGMLFTQAHSCNAVCTPSRYGLLTGRYNWREFDGITKNYGGQKNGREVPRQDDVTLAEFLKRQGYRTAAFGKWHLGGAFYRTDGSRIMDNPIDPAIVDWTHRVDFHAVDNGFDLFRGLACTINMAPYVYLKDATVQYYDIELDRYRDARRSDVFHYFTTTELDNGLSVGADSRAGCGDPSYKQIQADPLMIEQVEAYMSERASDPIPFFAYVALYSPHKPWHVTRKFKGCVGFEYGDFVYEVDDRIGRVIRAIDDNGMFDNTIVVLTSDNGPETAAFTNSRSAGHDANGPFRGVKRDSWEGGTRVPFIVRWPGRVVAGTQSDALIWQGDVFATMAEIIEADLGSEIAPDAESILPLLEGKTKTGGSGLRDVVVVSSLSGQLSLKTIEGWKLIDGTGGGGNNTSYDADNNDIDNAAGTVGEALKQIFYLPEDIGERRNLHAVRPDKAIHLIQQMEECRNKVKSEGSADIKQDNEHNSTNSLFEVLTLPAEIRNDFYARQLKPHVLTDQNYYYWGMSVIRDSGGLYHGYASRWPIAAGFKGWLSHSEIAHLVSESPVGPFRYCDTVISNPNPNRQDSINAHNPWVLSHQDKIFLYYVSNWIKVPIEPALLDAKPGQDWLLPRKYWDLFRNSQCIWIAVADCPDGPFIRHPAPVIVPHGQIKNIAVNPAVVFEDGQFRMILKGDDARCDGVFRIQVAATADSAEGPFELSKKPVFSEVQTEDAGVWYDPTAGRYYMTCHVMGQRALALFESDDWNTWQSFSQPVLMKKEFQLDDGTIWRPERVERPMVLTDNSGNPLMLYVAVFDQGMSGNIAVPLHRAESKSERDN